MRCVRIPPPECRAANVADFVTLEPASPVRRRAVVPYDEIAWPPAVTVNELGLRRMLGQIAQKHPRFRNGPADHRPCMGRQEQRLAAGAAVDPYKGWRTGRKCSRSSAVMSTKPIVSRE